MELDCIDLRFVVEMLRIGNLLDFDNRRFNDYIEVVDEIAQISHIHKEKHNAIWHVLVTPKMIEVTIDCKDSRRYRETRKWLVWLNAEITKFTHTYEILW